MNKILITGGAGFIGSNLSNYLLDLGEKVYVVDNLTNGKKEFLKKGIDLKVASIQSKEATAYVKSIKPEYIIHLAAKSSLELSFKNAESDLKANFFPIIGLVDLAKQIKVKKFIFSSSAAVYGNIKKLPISEDAKKQPVSPYGISKLAAEYYLIYANNKYDLPYNILRFSNVYGPNQNYQTEGGVIAIFIAAILAKKSINIFGNGQQTRDFIYIDDVIKAIKRSLESDITGDFNVSTSEETAIKDLAKILINKTEGKSEIRYQKQHAFGVSRNSLSYSKTAQELNWSPKVKLETGLHLTIDHFKRI